MKIKDYTGNISPEFDAFSGAVLAESPVNILSMAVVGSVLTPDFIKGESDINSIIVLEDVKLDFLNFMVELGREYSKHSIAPPLLMTPGYIKTSLDVFPVEFLNFQAIHHTVFGSDLLRDLSIHRSHLRLQCEREMKSKLLWLHQSYIESLGNEEVLTRRLSASITGYIPLFRAILFLDGQSIALSAQDTASNIERQIGIDTEIFNKILQLKKSKNINQKETEIEIPQNHEQLCDCFAIYYDATQRLAEYVEKMAD